MLMWVRAPSKNNNVMSAHELCQKKKLWTTNFSSSGRLKSRVEPGKLSVIMRYNVLRVFVIVRQEAREVDEEE